MAPMRLQKGETLGPYVVLEPIGAGGMGEVYRARDPRLARDVAIKILSNLSGADALLRFEREARATAALAHPNILTIFDVGVHDDLPFLVTEILDGQTLRARLTAGPLQSTVAVELGMQLLRGVAAAHALRIVHRDLKPENIFVSRDGTLKILDFGLAKLKLETAAGHEVTLDVSTEGKLVGTPAYMAPEQIRGEPADERADLFAAGAILYEMLSGQSPFRRDNWVETLAAILHESPAPLAAPIPPGLERLILHCLEKDRSARFQSARDVSFALESLQGDWSGRSDPNLRNRNEAAALGLGAHASMPEGLQRSMPERPHTSLTERTPGPSIAVLPFVDMSPTRDQDYLCDGIAEELINSLAHIQGLRVASRSSSFQFRTTAVDIRAVGARLGVATVMEGGVRKMGEQLRVTVQLVDVANGYQLWSQRFDRQLEDVFAIQDEIAESVATMLRGLLSHQEKEAIRRPEAVVEAYEYVLRGRQLVHRFQRATLEAARRMFERAIEIDANYALAHTGLAEVHAWVYEWWGGDATDFAAAERASQKALELAPNLPEAHAARGFVLSLDRRYAEAEKEFVEAIRLDPISFEAQYLFGRVSFARGEIERSVDLFRQAASIRPDDFQSVILLSQSLRMLGREKEALEAGREGVRRAEQRLEFDPADARALSLGANAWDDIGQRQKALSWSKLAIELHPNDQGVLLNGACLRARAGLVEEALDLLQRTIARGFGKRDWIEHDPDYESLRDDPRFQAMLQQLR